MNDIYISKPLLELVSELENVQVKLPTVDKLLSVGESLEELDSIEIKGIIFDSRDVLQGALFCALKGGKDDGHDYVEAAKKKGAKAALVEHLVEVDIVQIVVKNSREAMAKISSKFFGNPSEHLITIGVTGTNGKTSVTYILKSILNTKGMGVSLVGTLGGARTTPESPTIQRIMYDAVHAGKKAVIMEVSSHALVQHRVDGIKFDVVAFTNLSQDHLDFHKDMESYFQAKSILFEPERATTAIVHTGDKWGQRLGQLIREDGSVLLISVDHSEASDIKAVGGGVKFRFREKDVSLDWGGLVGVENAIMAANIASALGIDDEVIARGISGARAVPGRFQVVVSKASGTPLVVIDYAHTPQALATTLRSARAISDGELIVVFGCGGNRDRDKRPLMGEKASELADVVIVTSDNPRDEDALEIITQITDGVNKEESILIVEPDREEAIRKAINMARAGDVVVIAGKGHEITQNFGDKVIRFDDQEVARRVFLNRLNHEEA